MKTDINKYAARGYSVFETSTPRCMVKMFGKFLFTCFSVLFLVGAALIIFTFSYLHSLKDESINYDLNKLQINYTSFIYIGNSTSGVKTVSLQSSENRVWADYDKIPKTMKDAVVSIEDKRFYEHKGVDWIRTVGAAKALFTSGGSYGGSTITQQLVKNITGENQVSITRKVKEIFRALNLEKKYSKEEILTAYLNVVNFGDGCYGVQTAANTYFGKDISECDIAQCASIAGITQNPTAYNPLLHPDKNKERQQTVLKEMYGQNRITKAQYDEAMAESENMKFTGTKKVSTSSSDKSWDWYTDTMFEDVKEDLMSHYNCSSEKAVDMIYHGGLKIYSAEDTELQKIAEDAFTSGKVFPSSDKKLQGGYVAMDYAGRVLAIVGGRGEKTGNRLLSLATDTKRQPGSTIKPLAVYGPAINMGKINYSSLIEDEPLPNWKDGQSGPANAQLKYYGNVTVEYALQWSLNAASARLCKAISPNTSYNFLKDKLHFTSLEPADNTLAAMAVGGFTQGVTVREMTAGFQIFGNSGKYYKPYTYYYVKDHDGNVILDNRKETYTQVITPETSAVVHKLLNNVVKSGTGSGSGISGWDVYGKTGTTNSNRDSWFIAGTPYAVAGIWTGYRQPATIKNTSTAKKVWKTIMSQYLKNKQKKDFELSKNVVSMTYCKKSGLLAVPGVCESTAVGWYDKNNLPKQCSLDHTPEQVEPASSAGTEDESNQPETSSSQSGETLENSSQGGEGISSGETKTEREAEEKQVSEGASG